MKKDVKSILTNDSPTSNRLILSKHLSPTSLGIMVYLDCFEDHGIQIKSVTDLLKEIRSNFSSKIDDNAIRDAFVELIKAGVVSYQSVDRSKP